MRVLSALFASVVLEAADGLGGEKCTVTVGVVKALLAAAANAGIEAGEAAILVREALTAVERVWVAPGVTPESGASLV